MRRSNWWNVHFENITLDTVWMKDWREGRVEKRKSFRNRQARDERACAGR